MDFHGFRIQNFPLYGGDFVLENREFRRESDRSDRMDFHGFRIQNFPLYGGDFVLENREFRRESDRSDEIRWIFMDSGYEIASAVGEKRISEIFTPSWMRCDDAMDFHAFKIHATARYKIPLSMEEIHFVSGN